MYVFLFVGTKKKPFSQNEHQVNRVKLVKGELVEKVERFLEQQVRLGRIRARVTDAELIQLLEQIGASSRPQTITIARKRYGNDSDEEDDSDLM